MRAGFERVRASNIILVRSVLATRVMQTASEPDSDVAASAGQEVRSGRPEESRQMRAMGHGQAVTW